MTSSSRLFQVLGLLLILLPLGGVVTSIADSAYPGGTDLLDNPWWPLAFILIGGFLLAFVLGVVGAVATARSLSMTRSEKRKSFALSGAVIPAFILVSATHDQIVLFGDMTSMTSLLLITLNIFWLLGGAVTWRSLSGPEGEAAARANGDSGRR